MSYTNGVSNIDWDNLEKPWTFDQCKTRYIYGEDNISFRKLSKISGRAISLLSDWASLNTDENEGIKWVDAKEQYRKEVRTETHTKLVSDKSTYLAGILTKTQEEHIYGQGVIRNYLYDLILTKVKALASFKQGKSIEEITKEIESGKYFDADMEKKIKMYMLVKDGLEKTLGWGNYINPNSAMATLEKAGYIISAGGEDDNSDKGI